MPTSRHKGTAVTSSAAAGPPPTFVEKLWEVVNDPASQAVLSFTGTGDVIVIHNEAAFTAELLPRVCNSTSLNR
jgi:hypothetical protein